MAEYATILLGNPRVKCPYENCKGTLFTATWTGGSRNEQILRDSAGHVQICCTDCPGIWIGRSPAEVARNYKPPKRKRRFRIF